MVDTMTALLGLPPFAVEVISKLRRFEECASDSEGADIGREWFDILTQLGLLKRVQRSPVLWEMTKQGEDLLATPVLIDIVAQLRKRPALAIEFANVADVVTESGGFWNSCSGCHETEDGQPMGSYSYSAALQCSLGTGCSECGGLGAVWDNTDYSADAPEGDISGDQLLSTDSAALAPVAERTPKDYAIEHAWYMATAGEGVLEAYKAYSLAQMNVDEGGDEGQSELEELVDAARDDLHEALENLRGMTHQFRKRRDRAKAEGVQGE